jgi:hypothetical protein
MLNINLPETQNVQISGDPVCIFRGLGRGRGIPLPRQVGAAGCRPGKFEQLVFHSNDSLNGEDADENMGYFSPHVPGMYDETNRYIVMFV